MGVLTSFKTLYCLGYNSLCEVPKPIGENLEELHLMKCESLVRLQTSMGGLTSFNTLDCGGLESLGEVPIVGFVQELHPLAAPRYYWVRNSSYVRGR